MASKKGKPEDRPLERVSSSERAGESRKLGHEQANKDGEEPRHNDSKAETSGDEQPGQGRPGDGSRKMVRQLFRKGERFIEELLTENEKLKLRVMHLENEIRTAKREIPQAVSFEELQKVLDRLKRENDDLRRRYTEVLSETQKHKERYAQIEDENEKLVNLFVASYQLHSTLDFHTVVQVIIEVLLNFVGAGQFGLFMTDRESGSLHPLSSYGIGLEQLPVLDASNDVCRRCFEERAPFLDEKAAAEPKLDPERPTACIPLTLEGEVIGAIAIYAFLQQKTDVSQIDMEIFKLLSDHAAAVLVAARLFAESGGRKPSVEEYRELLSDESTS
jgi:hypothetical protein